MPRLHSNFRLPFCESNCVEIVCTWRLRKNFEEMGSIIRGFASQKPDRRLSWPRDESTVTLAFLRGLREGDRLVALSE